MSRISGSTVDATANARRIRIPSLYVRIGRSKNSSSSENATTSSSFARACRRV